MGLTGSGKFGFVRTDIDSHSEIPLPPGWKPSEVRMAAMHANKPVFAVTDGKELWVYIGKKKEWFTLELPDGVNGLRNPITSLAILNCDDDDDKVVVLASGDLFRGFVGSWEFNPGDMDKDAMPSYKPVDTGNKAIARVGSSLSDGDVRHLMPRGKNPKVETFGIDRKDA